MPAWVSWSKSSTLKKRKHNINQDSNSCLDWVSKPMTFYQTGVELLLPLETPIFDPLKASFFWRPLLWSLPLAAIPRLVAPVVTPGVDMNCTNCVDVPALAPCSGCGVVSELCVDGVVDGLLADGAGVCYIFSVGGGRLTLLLLTCFLVIALLVGGCCCVVVGGGIPCGVPKSRKQTDLSSISDCCSKLTNSN